MLLFPESTWINMNWSSEKCCDGLKLESHMKEERAKMRREIFVLQNIQERRTDSIFFLSDSETHR